MSNERTIVDSLNRCQYKYKDLTKRDILAALSYFKELNVIVDKYVYSTGHTRDLVSLNGTIPVNFKNSRYNIPVQIYLNDDHPYTAPLCYVRPTPDMTINVSEMVDPSGRVNMPCLREWNYPSSDLYMLLNLITIRFSEQTPLFSKVNRPNSTVGTNQYQPNIPTVTGNTGPLPYPADVRPSYPNYGSYPPANPSNMNPYASNSSGLNPYPSSISNSTPYPTNIANSSPYPGANNPYYPMSNNQPPLSYMKSGSGNNLIGQARPSYPGSSSSYNDETIKPEHYKMSLISAIQDKARAKYYELESIKKVEIDSLKRMNQDLNNSENQINNFINDAENEILTLNNMTIELKRKCTQLNENLNRMQHREKANIEDAVVTTMPLYRQLMQLFAEEMAIQDLVFYLSEGLQHKTISLDNFLKQVRFLSRKQFVLRATMQKARERAALPL